MSAIRKERNFVVSERFVRRKKASFGSLGDLIRQTSKATQRNLPARSSSSSMSLVKWLFVCLLSVLTGRLGAGVELGDELDSLLCPAMKEMKGKIIDVHKSLDLGATLLDGSWAPTVDQCASQCCHKTGCDLALYKNEGLSQSGKNCYYIKCGSMDNCVMVNHSGFTSILLQFENSVAEPGV